MWHLRYFTVALSSWGRRVLGGAATTATRSWPAASHLTLVTEEPGLQTAGGAFRNHPAASRRAGLGRPAVAQLSRDSTRHRRYRGTAQGLSRRACAPCLEASVGIAGTGAGRYAAFHDTEYVEFVGVLEPGPATRGGVSPELSRGKCASGPGGLGNVGVVMRGRPPPLATLVPAGPGGASCTSPVCPLPPHPVVLARATWPARLSVFPSR